MYYECLYPQVETKVLRELAHSPVDYCADKMFSENLRNKLVLDIEFSKTLYKEDGILGEIDSKIQQPNRKRIPRDS